MKVVDVVLLNISSPLMLGVYENNILIKTIQKSEKISDILSVIFEDLFKEYDIKNIVYINSPGSFLSIKLAYVFLKSLSICKDINIMAIDGFYFNNNSPIKGIMQKYFIKKNNKIILSAIDENTQINEFCLPKKLKLSDFKTDINPVYISPAVY